MWPLQATQANRLYQINLKSASGSCKARTKAFSFYGDILSNLVLPASLKKYQDDIQAGIAVRRWRRAELDFSARVEFQPSSNRGKSSSLQEVLNSTIQSLGAQADQLDQSNLPVVDRTDQAGHQDGVPDDQVSVGVQRDGVPVGQAGWLDPSMRVDPAEFRCAPEFGKPIKFWPLMAINANRRGMGGACRAYILAKSLDLTGLGSIVYSDLADLATQLKIQPKTWHRWVKRAYRLGLFVDRSRMVLAGYKVAAEIFGCDSVGVRPASISIGHLVSDGWIAYIWSAYEQTFNQRPISRDKLNRLTGIPERTQRRWDRRAGVERRPNYNVSKHTADELPGVMEFTEHKGAFVFTDKSGKNPRTAWRLPDIRTATAADSLKRGRSRKINKAIAHDETLSGLSLLGRASSYDDPHAEYSGRIFHDTTAQIKNTEKKLQEGNNHRPNEIYKLQKIGDRSNLWGDHPQGEKE
jgi:hypothetical protein